MRVILHASWDKPWKRLGARWQRVRGTSMGKHTSGRTRVEHALVEFLVEENGSNTHVTEGPLETERGSRCGRILRKTI